VRRGRASLGRLHSVSIAAARVRLDRRG